MPNWTTHRIVHALRRYHGWKQQRDAIEATMGGRSVTYGVPSRRTDHADPTATTAIRLAALEERCGAVEAWWAAMSPAERTAARYYMDGWAVKDVAKALGVNTETAQALVMALPLLILSRHYHGSEEAA